ncbi:MAG: hypothetical protein LBS55_09740 [Prevotellaceae bacterium]|jgi:hypothetical protein|nr:hypothetical protein [Prevotellaceae bacterium]
MPENNIRDNSSHDWNDINTQIYTVERSYYGNNLLPLNTYSAFDGDGLIYMKFDLAEPLVSHYKLIGKIFGGKLDLYDLPSYDEMFIGEGIARLDKNISYTFSEFDLLEYEYNISQFNTNAQRLTRDDFSNVIIEPDDVHVLTLYPPGTSTGFMVFDDYQNENNGPIGSLSLVGNSAITTDADRIFEIIDNIMIIFFDKDTIIKGVLDTPPPRPNGFAAYNIYEIDVNKGWNIIWVHTEVSHNKKMHFNTFKSNLNELPHNLMWVLTKNN